MIIYRDCITSKLENTHLYINRVTYLSGIVRLWSKLNVFLFNRWWALYGYLQNGTHRRMCLPINCKGNIIRSLFYLLSISENRDISELWSDLFSLVNQIEMSDSSRKCWFSAETSYYRHAKAVCRESPPWRKSSRKQYCHRNLVEYSPCTEGKLEDLFSVHGAMSNLAIKLEISVHSSSEL